jgi:hypothetical protein
MKIWRLSFSLQREGADLGKVDAINLHWYLTPAAIELLPDLKTLLKSFPPSKGKDFSATAIELEWKSNAYLKPSEKAWLEVTKAVARPGIRDIGLELTPQKGLRDVEGGSTLISALLQAGWQPVTFETIKKKSTEQRKVVLQKEELEKIIFKLGFQKPGGQASIKIPSEVAEILCNRITWGFAHVWYNRVILKSINVNFTKALFFKRWRPPQWEITL